MNEQQYRQHALSKCYALQAKHGINLTKADVGKVFVIRPGDSVGKLVTQKEFCNIPVAEIETWDTVSELDLQ